jgi:hypothetical protein
MKVEYHPDYDIDEEIVLDYRNVENFRESTTATLKKIEIQNAILIGKLNLSNRRGNKYRNLYLFIVGVNCVGGILAAAHMLELLPY